MHDLIATAKELRRKEPEGLSFKFFNASEGASIRYAVWPFQGGRAARGSIIFLPGRTEFIEKFYEDMRIMRGLGFASAAMDLRGQGLSTRPYGDREKHELDSFDIHISDVNSLVSELEMQNMPRPYIVVAHSAGGHVTLRTLHDHPGRLNGAILTAPMVKIAGGFLLDIIGSALASFMCRIGFSSQYVPGHQAFKDGRWGWRKRLTHDDERFKDEDFFIHGKERDLAVGGVTYRWLNAAYLSTAVLAQPNYAQSIVEPVLFLNASEDTIVDRRAIEAFAARVPKGRHVVITGSKHEILKETDAVRAKVYEEIIPFLDEIAPDPVNR